jgi:hypothetical protein
MSVITFRIRTSRGARHYFEVRVFPTAPALRRACRAEFRWAKKGLVACVIEVRDRRTPGLVGVVCLARTCLGIGIVTHEMAHAAYRLMERRRRQVRHWEHAPATGVPTVRSEEEAYATAIEGLTRDCWNGLYRAKVIVGEGAVVAS